MHLYTLLLIIIHFYLFLFIEEYEKASVSYTDAFILFVANKDDVFTSTSKMSFRLTQINSSQGVSYHGLA